MDMSRSLKTVLWVSFFFCIVTEAGSTACPPSSQKGPPFPMLPNSYQVDVEANIVDKGYTLEANIYYDYSGNRAAIKTFTNGSQSTLIFNYATNEIFDLQNTDTYYPSCSVETLTSSNLTYLFGKGTRNGNLHIAGAQTALNLGVSMNTVYMGNDTVRGIRVDHWYGCGNWSGQQINVDYSFTSANWSTATTAPTIPVRAEVTTNLRLPNGSMYHLRHIYDYFSYRPVLDIDPSVFQTPPGAVCPGRKNTKNISPIPDRFYYRVEKVYADISVTTFEDVWYDESYRVFRHDYKPLAAAYPTYSMSPLMEVHDFTRGVRYIIDKTLGNCTTLPITNYSMDAVQDMNSYKINGSFVLDMKNPLQFFDLELNYTYIGQQQVRGMFCDVYVAMKTDLYINGFISSPKTVITTYFLSPHWSTISESMKKIQTFNVPIKMDIQAVQSGLSMSYNFVDFDAEHPKLSVFDISQCYQEATKLTFQMTLPGKMIQTLTPSLLAFSQLNLAQAMGVSVLRVSNLHLDYDNAFIYITSTLLGRTKASAQFTVMHGTSASKQDDIIKTNVADYQQCASYCLTNDKSFICNGFDYCNDRTCHLSRYHIDHGNTLNSTTFCDHFSRNVQGAPEERSLTDAFQALRSAVFTGKYVIDEFTEKPLIAINLAILSGWANVHVSLPTIPDHFSYRLESTLPAAKQIIASTTWYDKSFNILRYDQHVNQAVYPFYTTDPLTIIEDYNNGIKYVINKMQGNCTMAKVAKDDIGSGLTNNGTWQVVLKNPLQIFHIDNSYRFIGQQTIRGMTCNVFESERTDFHLPTFNANITSLFRYAFLADDWSETDSAFLRTTNQPVRLEITVEQFSFYTQYNFYEFSDDTLDLSVFDIHQCFDSSQIQPFQVVFNGKFHPNLDTTSNMFVIESVIRMADLSSVSALRFQRTSLAYDDENIYLTSSLVEHRSLLIYFTKIPNGATVVHADKVIDGSTPETCASDCLYEEGFNCNSFYVCKESGQCLLSAFHVPDGPLDKPVAGCYAYSRTVQDKGQELSNLMAYVKLKNAVYFGNLSIDIPIYGTENTQRYVASSAQNPIRKPNETKIKEMAFKQFNQVAVNQTIVNPDSVVYSISVDDCAQACLDKNEYVCDGFDYYPQVPFGPYCGLVRHHPDLLNSSLINHNVTGKLFSRNYLTDFVQTPGIVPIASYVNAMIPNVQSDGDCAKLCFTNKQMMCRSLQYCSKVQQCLLFVDRVVGTPNISSTVTCNHYTNTYDKDFKIIDANNFAFRASVINTKDGSMEDCSKFCIDQQGDGCKGFYFCPHIVTCYLTSAPPDSADVNRSLSVMNFCNRYSRIYFPPKSSPSSAGTKATTVTVKLPTTAASTTTPTTSKTSSTSAHVPTTLTQSTKSSTVHTHGSSSTANAIPTPDSQRKGEDPSKASDTGELVGLSVGMLILGIILGVVGLYIFRRYRGLDKDGLKTNFAFHENM